MIKFRCCTRFLAANKWQNGLKVINYLLININYFSRFYITSLFLSFPLHSLCNINIQHRNYHILSSGYGSSTSTLYKCDSNTESKKNKYLDND